MQLCPAGKHYYDSGSYARCPYCEYARPAAPQTEIRRPAAPLTEIRSTPHAPKTEIRANPPAAPRTEIRPNLPAAPQTEISAPPPQNSLPVVGWLVVAEGAGKGRDFRLVCGENRIGYGAEMEVCLNFAAESVTTVGSDVHARVVYDPHANEFFVERGRSRELPLLNGRSVRGEPVLQAYDVLQVGQTKLVFVPLCGGGFVWPKHGA